MALYGHKMKESKDLENWRITIKTWT